MPTFEITSKVRINTNGVQLDKGTTFLVQLPFGQLPFSSISSKEQVIKSCLGQTGIDISNIKTMLHAGFFEFKTR